MLIQMLIASIALSSLFIGVVTSMYSDETNLITSLAFNSTDPFNIKSNITIIPLDDNTTLTIPPGTAIVKATGELVFGACELYIGYAKCMDANTFASILDSQYNEMERIKQEYEQRKMMMMTTKLPRNDNHDIQSCTTNEQQHRMIPIQANSYTTPLLKRNLYNGEEKKNITCTVWFYEELLDPWQHDDYLGDPVEVSDMVDCSHITDRPCTVSITRYTSTKSFMSKDSPFKYGLNELVRDVKVEHRYSEYKVAAGNQQIKFDIRGAKAQVMWRPSWFKFGGQYHVFCLFPGYNERRDIEATGLSKDKLGVLYPMGDPNAFIRDNDNWYHLDKRDTPYRLDAGEVNDVFTPYHCSELASAGGFNVAIWRSTYRKCWFKQSELEYGKMYSREGAFLGTYGIDGYRAMESTNKNDFNRWMEYRDCDLIFESRFRNRMECKKFEHCDDCVMMVRRYPNPNNRNHNNGRRKKKHQPKSVNDDDDDAILRRTYIYGRS